MSQKAPLSSNLELGTKTNFFGDDEEDPLGILEGATLSNYALGTTGIQVPNILESDYERGDPCEAIDAILRSSKDFRDRVALLQANALDAYKVEIRQLDKELALLPPTYRQYLAIREKTVSRRRQRSIAAAEASVSHPLNFHLSTSSYDPSAIEGSSRLEDNLEPETFDTENSACLVEGSGDGKGPGEEQTAWSRKGLDCDKKGYVDPPLQWLEEAGGSAEMQGTKKGAERRADRRCSTRARFGSATENSIVRPLTSYQQTNESNDCGNDDGIQRRSGWQRKLHQNPQSKREVRDGPALWRSKLRERQMVFSLLEATHAEEESMEYMYFECPAPASQEGEKQREVAFRKLDEVRIRNAKKLEALLVEYDSRARTSRREHTLEKLRKVLPCPDLSQATTGSGSSCMYHLPSSSTGMSHQRAGSVQLQHSTRDHHGTDGVNSSRGFAEGGHFLRSTTQRDQRIKGNFVASEARRHKPTVDESGGGGGDGDDGGTLNLNRGKAGGGGGGEGKSAQGDNCSDGGYVDDFSGLQPQGKSNKGFHATRDNQVGGISEDDAEGESISSLYVGGFSRGVNRISRPPEMLEQTLSTCAGRGKDVLYAVNEEVLIDGHRKTDPGLHLTGSPVCCANAGSIPSFLASARENHSKDTGNRPLGGAGAALVDPGNKLATGQRKMPTLPDPNEVNDSVMADPFNMDHMKDLPGLVAGETRGLSMVVSNAVTYVDPAFPNLEFHRRAAMDKEGYFMPGYKPRVNSPGPAAGAYWLARRQSYRVKMAIPVHEQYGHGEDGRQQVSNRAPSSTSRHPARRRTRQWFKGATSARPTTSTAVTGRRVAPGNICKGAGVTSHSRRKGKGSSASRIRTEGGKGFFPLYEPRSLGKG